MHNKRSTDRNRIVVAVFLATMTAFAVLMAALASASNDSFGRLYVFASPTLTVTATGADDAAVTLTLPSVASEFHYITQIQAMKYVTGTVTASAVPIIVTTTNLESADLYFRRVGALADSETQSLALIQSAAAGTGTTIVAPAVTGVKWHLLAVYSTGP